MLNMLLPTSLLVVRGLLVLAPIQKGHELCAGAVLCGPEGGGTGAPAISVPTEQDCINCHFVACSQVLPRSLYVLPICFSVGYRVRSLTRQ